MKTADLTGTLLDYWVALALGYTLLPTDGGYRVRDENGEYLGRIGERPNATTWLRWSEDWAQGGPIIERTGMAVVKFYEPVDGPVAQGMEWAALSLDDSIRRDGPTPLIAAMRALVASKFGDEVPDEPAGA